MWSDGWPRRISNDEFMKILFSLVTLGGLWLFFSPFVLGYLGLARGNALLIGLLLTVIGIMGVAGVTGRKT